MKNHGKFITQAKAQKQINDYVRNVLPKRNIPANKAVIGNLFSLKEIKQLLTFIDNYNSQDHPEDQKIGGVRVYNGWNDESTNDDKTTVFLIPVKNDGKDLKAVYTIPSTSASVEDADDSTLGDPLPCPNNC